MTRRRITVLLHWTSFVLLVLLVSGGTAYPLLVWAFVLSGLAMTATALLRGLMTRPGPKLEGIARNAHPWMHRGMYALLTWAALVAAAHQLGLALPGPDLSLTLMILLSASSLHAIFHLWRHTALGDGALRIITPKALHKVL
ncbi:hypothetical protein ACOXXX_17545 [Thalassococcus sp. BH17M4-6]|uniref:hypothetical protein n=1 Tax=Thalassococcus sp. BH17M4-6 TaxID=3413148 RepID=UPI003BCEB8B4